MISLFKRKNADPLDQRKCVEKRYRAMGGEFLFRCFPQNFHSHKDVEKIFDQAYQEIKRIEEKFTDYKPSPFNQINDCAGINPCVVDEETFNLVQQSIKISEDSNGIFDISYASVGHPWRIAKTEGFVLSALERNKLKQYIDYKKIKLNKKEKSIYLPHKKMRIGLGGIGKGYAVDSAFKLCKHAGLYNFYVNGSGDIRVHSNENAPRAWKIGIRNPLSSDPSKSIGIIQMTNGAIATSGGYIQKINNHDNKADHHIIDSSSGRSREEVISSTVIAKDALDADVIATILMNLSSNDAVTYLNNQNLIGCIVSKNGTCLLSDKAITQFGI